MKSLREGRLNSIFAWGYRKYFQLINHKGTNVMEEEWDYLIILDACRYDVFEELNWLEGELSRRVSQGSTSIEFLNENFNDYYYNTVYVSANPFVSPHPSADNFQQQPFNSEDHFPYVNQVYMKEEHQEEGVSNPEGVTKEALSTREKYPDSRMIVHYMQPHAPYIGDFSLKEGSFGIPDLRNDGYSWEEIKEAYTSNLKRALESVEDLVEELDDGKVVVTADHGELLGEHWMHSHPHGVYFKELVEVPWFEVKNT